MYVEGDGAPPTGTEEGPWVVEYGGEYFNADRFGCFTNENGIANVRLNPGTP